MVTAALLLAVSLAAIDDSIVGTAMPTIAAELGGFNLYSWVFSAYLLTSTTTVPLFGKLADVIGRKRVFTICTVIFVVGSGLCAAAHSMMQLIAFRALQGIGAGGVMPVAMTLVADIYPLEQRPRMDGLMSAMWGISAVAGPALGGLIVDHFNWRWIFLINLPAGAAAIVIGIFSLRETLHHLRARIDYTGTVLLTLAVAAMLTPLISSDGPSVTGLGAVPMLALSATMLGAFVIVERRAADPMMPVSVLRNRVVLVSCVGQFMLGGVLLAFAAYVPLLVQAIMGRSAMMAGLAVAPVSLGWPLGAYIGGKAMLRWGTRRVTLGGSAFVAAGCAMIAAPAIRAGYAGVASAMLIAGIGFGCVISPFFIASQNSVGWTERGIATAMVSFFATLGGSIWVALMGAVAAARLAGAAPSANVDDLLRMAVHGRTAAEGVRHALSDALGTVFVVALVLSIVSWVAMLFFPGGAMPLVGRDDSPNGRA
jgi:EmrB/QacA subfamily drug resistance transporter